MRCVFLGLFLVLILTACQQELSEDAITIDEKDIEAYNNNEKNFINGYTFKENYPRTCSDSDSMDVYTQGTIIHTLLSNPPKIIYQRQDQCFSGSELLKKEAEAKCLQPRLRLVKDCFQQASAILEKKYGNSVIEQYCSGFSPKIALRNCSFGCSQGKCILHTSGNLVPLRNQNITYKIVDGHHIMLDLFIPRNNLKNPLIIWVHGGGWKSGSKENCLAKQFVSQGYAVACIDYRLSQVSIFPAQIEDVKDAIAWLRENSNTYNLNPDKFAIWGESAGGHLAALAGTTSDIDIFDRQSTLSSVQAVINFFGPIDLVALAQTNGFSFHAEPTSEISQLMGGPILTNKDKARQANPITYISANDPPFLIIHGTNDQVVSVTQSETLHRELDTKEVKNTLILYPDAQHGSPEFSSPATMESVKKFLNESFS